jgi:hypothetical protein
VVLGAGRRCCPKLASYLQARLHISKHSGNVTLKMLKSCNLPYLILRNIRDQLVFQRLDTLTFQSFSPQTPYHRIKAESSLRFKPLISKHNENMANLEWFSSFTEWPPLLWM